MSNLLVRLFGWRATLFHGDPLVYDRWCWLDKRLRYTRNDDKVMDVGCGSGAFTIGLAKRGYRVLGLSWDMHNQKIAEKRAEISGAKTAAFEIFDVRHLDERPDWKGQFDAIICCENIEHICDDFRLMRAMADVLKPGGRLLLTTPYIRRAPQSFMDYGPFPDFEDGRHVRRGYSQAMLRELCSKAGLDVEEIGFISGPLSQSGAWWLWKLGGIHVLVGWLAILPIRFLAPLIDRFLMRNFDATAFCIALEAYKPRTLDQVHRLDALDSISA